MLVDSLVQTIDPSIRDYFDFSETGIIEVGGPINNVTVYEALGWSLKKITDDTVRWWIGDWLVMTKNASEATYQVLSEKIWGGHYGSSALENLAWVCRNIKHDIRRPELGFWKHKVVAAEHWSDDERRKLLAYAIDNELSYAAFQKYVNGISEDEPTDVGGNPRYDDAILELQIEQEKLRSQLQKEMDNREAVQAQLEQFQDEVNALFADLQLIFEYLVEVRAPESIVATMEKVRDKVAQRLA
jgi:hypothetical protein